MTSLDIERMTHAARGKNLPDRQRAYREALDRLGVKPASNQPMFASTGDRYKFYQQLAEHDGGSRGGVEDGGV